MTLDEFHTLISGIIKRGASADSFIPAATRQAARWIERNYTLQYMKHYVSFSFDTSAVNPRALPFPSTLTKSVNFVRLVQVDGSYAYLTKTDPRDVLRLEEGQPVGYWLDAFDYIWVDKIPLENYSAEMYYNEYTSWPTDVAQSPWLLANAEDLMIARTIKQLGPIIRNPDLIAAYETIGVEALRTLLLADEELQHENESNKMNYGVVW